MSRAAAGTHGVNLMPLLDVLLCTMGTLIVILGVINREARLHPAKRLPGKTTAQQQEQLVEAREDLQLRIQELNTAKEKTVADLNTSRTRLAGIEASSRELEDRLAALTAAAKQLPGADASDDPQRDKLRLELAQLNSQRIQLEQDLQKARREAGHRQPGYAVIPFDEMYKTSRRPIYIECRGDSVILQPEGIVFGPQDFLGPGGPSNPLASALRAAQEYWRNAPRPAPDMPNEPYPLLLVRPTGIIGYYLVRDAMSSWDAEFGYELVGEDWKLEFPNAPDPQLQEMENRAVAESRQQLQWLAQVSPELFSRKSSKTEYHVSPFRGGVVRDGGPSLGNDPFADDPLGGFGRGNRNGNSAMPGSAVVPEEMPAMALAAVRPLGLPAILEMDSAPDSRGWAAPLAALISVPAAAMALVLVFGNAGPEIASVGPRYAGNGNGVDGFGNGGNGSVNAGSFGDGPQLADGGGSSNYGNGFAGAGAGANNGTSAGSGTSNGNGTGNYTPGGNSTGQSNGMANSTAGSANRFAGARSNGVPGNGSGSPSEYGGVLLPNSAGGMTNADRMVTEPVRPDPRIRWAPAARAEIKTDLATDNLPAATHQPARIRMAAQTVRQVVAVPDHRVRGLVRLLVQVRRVALAVWAVLVAIRMLRLEPPSLSFDMSPQQNMAPYDDSTREQQQQQSSSSHSMARNRGKNWALPTSHSASVPVQRPIRVECFSDRLELVPDTKDQQVQVIPLGPRTEDAVEPLVGAVRTYTRTWGMAGRGMYWKPQLVLNVNSNADSRAADLQTLLADSGWDVKRK